MTRLVDGDLDDVRAEMETNDPAVVVAAALDGLEAGATEVLADEDTRAAKRSVAP